MNSYSPAEVFVSGYCSAANLNKEVNWDAMDTNWPEWERGYLAFRTFDYFLRGWTE